MVSVLKVCMAGNNTHIKNTAILININITITSNSIKQGFPQKFP